jgi:hypothetical protein
LWIEAHREEILPGKHVILPGSGSIRANVYRPSVHFVERSAARVLIDLRYQVGETGSTELDNDSRALSEGERIPNFGIIHR